MFKWHGVVYDSAIGSNELAVINNYLNVRDPHRYWRYLNGQINEYDWNKGKIESFQTCAGFYPCSEEAVGRYVDMCVEDMKEVDVLGSWLKEEYYVEKYLSRLKYKKAVQEKAFIISKSRSDT